MKKTLIAIASLSTLAGVAHAQSSVTVYGRVDQSIRQSVDAVSRKEIANGSGSRLGFRGAEDLGNGLKAIFQIEHRFDADTGAQSSTAFWHGKSIVGLEGSFGKVTLGREENAAYLLSQSVADPWSTDTVARIADTITRPSGVSNQRYSNSINYMGTFGDFTAGAQYSLREDAAAPVVNNPYAIGFAYKGGPIVLGFGYENPGAENDNWLTVNGSYAIGDLRLGAFFGTGHLANDQKIQSWLASAVYKLGSGELRAAYGQRKNKDLTANQYLNKRAALGYHYALSKRTTLYTDLAHENKDNMTAGNKKTGWDFGIKHNF
jgi:predicted porin